MIHSLRYLVWLFTASVSLSTDIVPVTLSLTSTLRARQSWCHMHVQVRKLLPRTGSSNLERVELTDSETQVMHTERDGLMLSETEWPLKASLSKAV